MPTAWLEKVRLAGEMLAPGVAPVPVRLTFCGLPAAVSYTYSVPLRVPVVVGVKITLIVQEELAARLLPQLLVWEKSPMAATLAISSAAAPELLSVTG